MMKGLGLGESVTSVVTLWQVLVGVILAAALSLLVVQGYRKVQSEASYSQNLAHSFVLIAMVTSLIMILIGSNMARAFSLVGAMSIIRFRTAIKSPLDVAFVFLSISIGMACGTGFWWAGTVATVLILTVMILMHLTNVGGGVVNTERLLSVCFHMDVDHEAALEPMLGKFFTAYSVAYLETIRQGTLREVVYSVQPKPDVKDKDIIDAVVLVNGNLKVSYRTVRHAVEVP